MASGRAPGPTRDRPQCLPRRNPVRRGDVMQPRLVTHIALRAEALTPIHVGDGTDMRLDEYLLDDPTMRRQQTQYDEYGEEIEEEQAEANAPPALCRFDPVAAMKVLAQRNEFRRSLERGDLGQAFRLLRGAGASAILERIEISPASASALREAMEHPARRSGEVKPFIRSAGRPFIPGSSLKGAFRTALASHRLPPNVQPQGLTH